MSEKKNAEVTDYRRGYSYKDVGILLGIPEEQVGKLANEIMKNPPRFLTAVDIDRVWCKAKPWLVTLNRSDRRFIREHHRMLQDTILKAGGIRVFDRIQWRFAAKQEAEEAAQDAAQKQPAIDGYTWVALRYGYETPWGEGTSVRVEDCDDDEKILGSWTGVPVLD